MEATRSLQLSAPSFLTVSITATPQQDGVLSVQSSTICCCSERMHAGHVLTSFSDESSPRRCSSCLRVAPRRMASASALLLAPTAWLSCCCSFSICMHRKVFHSEVSGKAHACRVHREGLLALHCTENVHEIVGIHLILSKAGLPLGGCNHLLQASFSV